MKSTHLNNVDFSFIRYANCWEDADVLLEALQVTSDSRVVSIASGGDNCFSLLSEGPHEVLGVDLSEVQLFLVELKREAIRIFDREAYLKFTGVDRSDERGAQYDALRETLSPAARAFWDDRIDLIEEGIIHIGKFERFFQMFREEIVLDVYNQDRIDQLFAPKSDEHQQRFYEEKWFEPQWEKMHANFFTSENLGKMGRDPSFLKEVEGEVSQTILHREIQHLRTKRSQKNPFLFYILNNRFDERHMPHYMRPGVYEKVKANIHKLNLRNGLIEDVVSNLPETTHLNLSDIFEYMGKEDFLRAGRSLGASLKSGVRVAYWSFMVKRVLSEAFPDVFQCDEALSTRLSDQDMGYFYGRFTLDTVK